MSATCAAKVLSVRSDAIKEAVNSGQIQGVLFDSGIGHKHTIVDSTMIHKLRDKHKKYCSKLVAQNVLGIGKRLLNRLIDIGIIKKLEKHELPPLTKGCINITQLSKILKTFNNQEKHPNSFPSDCLSLKEIPKKSSSKQAVDHVLHEIFSGNIEANNNCIATNLGELLFNRVQIEKALSQQRGAPTFSAQKIAKLGGWKPEVVAFWCSQGHLNCIKYMNAGKPAYNITLEDLLVFQKTFLPLADLANQLGTRSSHLLRKLDQRNIPTLPGKPTGSTERGRILKLSQLDSLLLGG